MKTLSVRQPWASLIASGRKTVEARSWSTAYRGPLLIVSCRNPPIEPAGMALAVVTLTDVRPMRRADAHAACVPYVVGAYAWILSDVREIEPFSVQGRQGFYEVDFQHGAS